MLPSLYVYNAQSMSKILDSRTLHNLSTLGDSLFGRALRLRVAHWVLTHEAGTFFQGEVATGVSYSASAVAQELDRLVDLGMLIRHPRTAGDRRQYYSRTESQVWEVIQAAVEAVTEPRS